MFDIAEYDNLSDMVYIEAMKLMRKSFDDYKETKDILVVAKKSKENFNQLCGFYFDFRASSMSEENFESNGLNLALNELLIPLFHWADTDEFASGECDEAKEFTYRFLIEMTCLINEFASLIETFSERYFSIKGETKGLLSENAQLTELYPFVLIHKGLQEN